MAITPLQLLEGKRYGRLIVIAALARIGNNRKVICRCDCGTERSFFQANLCAGRTTSCECACSEIVSALHTRHGEAGNAYHGRCPTPEYKTWLGMKERCGNPKRREYARYGGRGITICQRWAISFEAFLQDMGRRPTSQHQIDRKDNDGHYEPGNCRWATPKEQQSNTTRSKFVYLNGERLVVAEAIRRVGIKSTTFWERVRRGWSFDRALLTEIQN